MWKHVVIERPLPGKVDEFVAIGVELWGVLEERGWPIYKAWVVSAGDEGEPPLFDVGILGRATQPDGVTIAFESDFVTREALEATLDGMRADSEVVKRIVRAAELVDREASRSYILEQLTPGGS